MKKVLIITYYWPPSGGSGVQRWLKFVKYLPELHIEPIILTVDPEKASFPVRDSSLSKDIPSQLKVYKTNTQEPYGWYKKLTVKKEIPYAGFANESSPGPLQKLFRFIRGNFFIPDSRKGWNTYAFEQASNIIKEENIDCVITTSPPHSTQLIGLKLKQKFNIKWIADLRDPWTDIYYYNEFYHLPFAKKLDLQYERQVLEKADEIVVVSNSIKKGFLTKSNQLKASKFHVIPNGYDEEDFMIQSKKTESFVLSYTGTLSDSYHTEPFFQLLAEVVNELSIPFTLRLVGRISENVLTLIQGTSLKNCVEVVGYVDHVKSLEYLMDSTALFLAIPDIPDNKGILTGKLFEYLASQKPIICVGPPDGDAAEIINDCEAGRVFDYTDVETMKTYLRDLLLSWKGNKDIHIDNKRSQQFSRKKLTEKLSKLI